MHAILAARSNFSIGESILTVERLVDAAVEVGATSVALTDTMSVTALIEFTQICKKADIKAIIGCRLRLVDDPTWRKPKGEKAKTPPEYFLTYYVLSEKGLLALFKLLTLANSESHFYTNAKLGFSDLFDALSALSAEDVAIASSDVSSVFHHAQAVEILQKCSDALSASNVFLTLSPVNTPLFDTLNKKAIYAARTLGLPTLVTRPLYYGKDEADAAEVMNAISSNTALSSLWHKSPAFRDLHPMTLPDLLEECKGSIKRLIARGETAAIVSGAFKQGLRETDRLVDMVKYEWKKAPVSLPTMAADEFGAVVAECKKGWTERFSDQVFGHKPDKIDLETTYKERLKYELTVLKNLNFSGYFLLVQDVVRFAKSNGILVGPGRGSVGGSLVAYLMGITDCDPIRFGLLFERFINPDRIDLPDADLDFMSERRHEVIAYLIEKYGQGRVAGVSNFMTLGPASAIRDVSKAFGLDEREYACSKFAPKEHGQNIELVKAAEITPEIGAFRDKFEPIWDTCLTLEGVMRTVGQHAAGIVVGGCDLVERAVIERRKGDERVVCFDKRTVEDQGLVKIDILGLSTLDLIDLTLQYIRKRHSKKINLMRIPLDDPKVLENFATGATMGIFQFEGGGMRRLIRELGKGEGGITFDDITAATALYRPGPMDSGMMDAYWKRKQGIEPVEYEHPALEDATRDTLGVIVYQESVMRAARDVAGYSMAEADKLRKIMGKKLPDEMAKQRDKFVDGCIKTVSMTGEEAGILFDKIEKFAGYGFNKAHSVTYTMISYQSMYLRTYFTVEFFAAALSLMKDDKLPGLLKDAERLGIKIELPEINMASDNFEILTDTRLMIPFTRIKGLSANAAKAIVEARKAGKFTSVADFAAKVNKRLVHKGKIEILEKLGCFAAIEPTHLPIDSPTRIKDQIDLIPGLIASVVPINREMQLDVVELRTLEKLHALMHERVKEDGIPVRPYIGKESQFMIVFDCPSSQEEEENMMFMSKPSRRPFALERVQESLDENDIRVDEAYWTALIKRPKGGKQVSPAEIKLYAPFFQKELDVVKPPIIVLLGATTVRSFIPDFKGKASEEAGKIVYDRNLDANLVLGFSPGEIWHDPDKQIKLNEVFASVKSLME